MTLSFSNSAAAIVSMGALVVGLASTQGVKAQGAKLVADGVYTEEQATRGAETYKTACAACHMPDLRGEGFAPALSADAFAFRWDGGKLGDLLKIVKGTMPMDNPGSLKPAEFADIVAYLLKANGFKAGQALSENPADLAQITFPKK